MKQLLRGRVRSGRGDFGFWLTKLKEHYRSKTGMSLFPGTLNVELSKPFSLPTKRSRLEGHEYGGTVSVNIVPCRILGLAAFILRTDANELGAGDHPRTIVEVATNANLRKTFGLQDGDFVEVEVDDDVM